MKSQRVNTLLWRMMLSFGSVVVITLLVSSLILNLIIRGGVERQLATGMVQDAREVALWAAPLMGSGSLQEDLLPHMPLLQAVTEGQLWLVAPDGTVVADTDPDGRFQNQRLDHPLIRRVLNGEVVQQIAPDPWLKAAITVGYPMELDGKVVGAVFLFVTQTRLWEVFGEFRVQIGLALVGLTLIGLWMAYRLSRSFAQPIEQMSIFAHDLGQKRFRGALEPSGITEIDRLGEALQQAARELQVAFEELEEQQERIRSLIEDMAEGVVAVDEHRQILLVNPAAGRLLGLPGPFSPGTPVESAGFPDPLVAVLKEVVETPGLEDRVVQFCCGAAQLQAHVSPVAPPGAPSGGAVALLQDVTQEVKLKQLRENFVANVSHELRAPLASLLAGVEAMNDGLIAESQRPRYLKAMLMEMTRMTRLVDDLLELSRLDAGTTQLSLEEFDLQPLCDGLREKWEPRCTSGGIQMEVECPHLRVVANYDRVEEILSNFLDNAIRFTPMGGHIRLYARPEGDMVRVGVADSGVGISQEHLPHIWDRFYKADPARTRGCGEGTGLGLSIVKQLVERLGGEVSVESQVGVGSNFSFTLVAAR